MKNERLFRQMMEGLPSEEGGRKVCEGMVRMWLRVGSDIYVCHPCVRPVLLRHSGVCRNLEPRREGLCASHHSPLEGESAR